ncbi:MAG: RING finger protein [Pirellulaceae bacterium]
MPTTSGWGVGSTPIDRLGARYKGRVEGGFWGPRLQFEYRDLRCFLQNLWYRSGSRGVTVLTVDRIAAPIDLEIVAIELNEHVRRNRKLLDLKTDDANFDKRFLVRAESQEMIDRIATDEFRWLILEMANRFSGNPIWLRVSRGRWELSIGRHLRSELDLYDFLRLSLGIMDRVHMLEVEGISFSEGNQTTDVDDIVCPVCSGRLGKDVVRCVSCKTLHCRECWEYNGRCAMFACNETRSLRL